MKLFQRQAHRPGNPDFPRLEQALHDLARGALSEADKRLVEAMVQAFPDLQDKFARITAMYEEGDCRDPDEASTSVWSTAWQNAAAMIRSHAENVRAWWTETEQEQAIRLPLGVLCSTDGGQTLACNVWDALEHSGGSLRLPDAAPVASAFLPDSRIVFSWRPLPGDPSVGANVLVLMSPTGEELLQVPGESAVAEGEERMKVVLDAKTILNLYDAGGAVENHQVEVIWSCGAQAMGFAILRQRPPSDSTACTTDECEAIADAALTSCGLWAANDTSRSEDIACFVAALLRVKGERERALIRDFLFLRDYVWAQVSPDVFAAEPILTYLAAAASVRSGGFITP